MKLPAESIVNSNKLSNSWLDNYKPKEKEVVLVVSKTKGYKQYCVYHKKYRGHSGNGLVDDEIKNKYKNHLWHVREEFITFLNQKPIKMKSQIVFADQRESVFP